MSDTTATRWPATCPDPDPLTDLRIVRLTNGNILVARTAPGDTDHDIRAQLYDPSGRRISVDLQLATGRHAETPPRIDALPGGGFVLIQEAAPGQGEDIELRQFDAAGELETLVHAHYDERQGCITGIVAELALPA